MTKGKSAEDVKQNKLIKNAAQELKINRRRLDFTIFMTVSLGIISLCALIVSFYQARLMRQQSDIMFAQNRASVLPILEIDNERSFKNLDNNNYQITRYQITATNKGNGPLIITGIELKYGGSSVRNWEELFALYPNSDSLYLDRANDVLDNSVLLPGEKITFIDSKENEVAAQVLYEMMDDVKLKVCYTSVFEDLFQDTIKGLNNRVTNTVEEISFCKIKDGSRFQD
ncbi:MAG: hypothetical protein AAGH46_07835 [Bacteroidota bacterium]